MKFVVTNTDHNTRLDVFLTAKIKTVSRSQIKKNIEHGRVTVNGKPADVHRFLKPGDQVEYIQLKPIVKSTIEPVAVQSTGEPRIITDETNFLILEKPTGLLVHPTERNEPGTLVAWLERHYPTMMTVGENRYRAGIIHRLDRDVSGIMVVAKNQPTFEYLKEQFKARKVKKEYIALVYGHMTQPSGTIALPIGRRHDGQFVAHPRAAGEKFSPTDRVAKTEYSVLEYIKDYSLLKVRILTGRTHQIRIHLSAIGHPIIGDTLYRPKTKIFHFLRRRIKVINPGRIFLHSTLIGFNDSDGSWQEYTSPLPDALTTFINELKKN